MALGYPGFPLITPEDDPYLTGVESPQWQDYAPDPFTPQTYPGGRGQGILEALSGLEGMNLPQPTSFGEGLAYGLGRGLGASGTRALQRRQQFEAEQKMRQQAADAERLAATREFRAAQRGAVGERGKVMRERIKEDLQTKREQEKFDRENPPLTEKDIADNPWLAEAGFPAGSRPPERIRAIIAESRVPKAPKNFLDTMTPEQRIKYEEDLAKAKARGERAGAPPIKPTGAQAGKIPSATERAALAADVSALQQMGSLEKLYKRDFVGPGRGRVAAAQASGVPFVGRLSMEQGDFRAALAQLRNAVINQLSGAAVSESEARRMEQQLPNENDPSEAFESKLRQTRKNIERLATTRRQTYSQTGLDLSGLSPPGQVNFNQYVMPD